MFAGGALAAIIMAVSSAPVMPQSLKTPRHTRGITPSFISATQSILHSLSADFIFAFERYGAENQHRHGRVERRQIVYGRAYYIGQINFQQIQRRPITSEMVPGFIRIFLTLNFVFSPVSERDIIQMPWVKENRWNIIMTTEP